MFHTRNESHLKFIYEQLSFRDIQCGFISQWSNLLLSVKPGHLEKDSEALKKNNMIVLKPVVFVITYITLLAKAEESSSFSKIKKWPDTQTFIYSPFIDNTSLTWAACDHSESWESEPKCSVMREIYHFDGTSDTLSCDVVLEPKNEINGLYDHLKVVLFGKDRAILVSARRLKNYRRGAIVQFSAVHFPTCNVVQNSILYTEESTFYGLSNSDPLDHLVTITAYEDKYDVTFKNKTLCDKKLCTLSIDTEGKIISEPESLSVDDLGEASTLGSMPISSNSASKGHLLTQRDTYFKKENQVTLILPSGTKNLKNVERSTDGSWISMTYDMIGFCDLLQLPTFKYAYFCAQYDQEGNLKKEMNLDFDTLQFIRSLHNLPGGGFLLFTSRDKIIKIDSEGKVIPQAFKVENFTCEKELSFNDAFIFEKDDKEVCVSRACSLHSTPRKIKLPEVPTLDFAVKCFTYDTLKEVIGDFKTG